MSGRQRVAVVTGGGGGIGAAIAHAVAATGTFVVTVDPLVSVDGSEKLPEPEHTTAGRIVAEGGAARASGVSVTDAREVAALFTDLAAEFGQLDAVVNVAGISRPTSYTRGSERDWADVLSVHLDGYRNVLRAALPLMAEAGQGHILGVTSGSGWRAADTGAYGCAKRAVAALTWQVGRHAPEGVVINAISPIAATRMVAAALSAAQKTTTAATGGLSLTSMPAPEDLGPLGAHLVADGFNSCRGRVLFAGGSEVAVIDEPRLIEVVRSGDNCCSTALFEAATSIALEPAELRQVSGGGSNARFGSVFNKPPGGDAPAQTTASTCAVVSDNSRAVDALSAALHTRGVVTVRADNPAALADIVDVDSVVIALSGERHERASAGMWESILDDHDGIAQHIALDARWARAVAEFAQTSGRSIRLVTIGDATSPGGRSRAQASAQLARAASPATGGLVQHFAVSAESADIPADFAAHLICSPDAAGIAGAELVSGTGWFGLRSHPRPIGTLNFGGPELPPWFDHALREVVQPQ